MWGGYSISKRNNRAAVARESYPATQTKEVSLEEGIWGQVSTLDRVNGFDVGCHRRISQEEAMARP